MSKYDVAIIGSGPGGYVAAIRAGQLGLKTVCIEANPNLGGTCLNVGCIPSKTLLHSTEVLAQAGHTPGLSGDLKADLSLLMKRKEGVISQFNRGIEGLFKKNKVDTVIGHARLTGPHTIQVGSDTIEATSIILATGSEPAPLPFLPFDEKVVLSNTGALALKEVPKELVIIGAGVIGLELGSVYGRLGAKVTVLEFLDHICPTLDRDISKAFQAILAKQGIEFHLSTKVVQADVKEGVTLTTEKGETFTGDRCLVSIGRRPYTKDLGLENVGITPDRRGYIPIDGHFRTAVTNIYAIGDIVDGPMLAHKASEEGVAVAEIIAGQAPHINYPAIPTVVYTAPEVAGVGMTEEEAKAAGLPIKTGSFPLKANSRAACTGQTDGLVKIIAHGPTDRLLGMHIIAAHASEMIGEGVVALEKRVTVTELAAMSHAHPTLTEAIKEACLAVHKRQIHL